MNAYKCGWKYLPNQYQLGFFLTITPRIGARTYFSGHILEMFDKELLQNSPAVVSELDWGGLCIDILNNPLESDSDTLLDNWLQVMKYLEPAQVMAIPSFDEDQMGITYSPNVAWKEYLES